MDGAGRFDTSFKPIYFETQGSVTDRGAGTGFLGEKSTGRSSKRGDMWAFLKQCKVHLDSRQSDGSRTWCSQVYYNIAERALVYPMLLFSINPTPNLYNYDITELNEYQPETSLNFKARLVALKELCWTTPPVRRGAFARSTLPGSPQ